MLNMNKAVDVVRASYLPKAWIRPLRLFAWSLVIIAGMGYWYRMPDNTILTLGASCVIILIAAIILMDCRFSEAYSNRRQSDGL